MWFGRKVFYKALGHLFCFHVNRVCKQMRNPLMFHCFIFFVTALVYEILYRRVFSELDRKENSFKGCKQNPTTDMDSMMTAFYQNGLEDDNAFKEDSEDNSGWTEVVRGRSSKGKQLRHQPHVCSF